MSTVLHRPAQQDAALPAPAPARAPRRARPVTLVRSGWRSSVPVWLGWALQAIAVSLVLVAVPQILFPDEVYWAASYFSVVGLTPEPFVFNAVLLFIVGAAAKRRQRGAWAFLMLFEAPTIGVTLWEIAAVLSVSPDVRFDVTADVIAGAVAAGVMALLIVTRGEFSARLEPAAYRSAALVFVAGVAAAVAVGGTLSQLFPGTLTSVRDDWWWALNSAIGLSPNEIFLDDLAGRPDAGVGLLVTTMSAVSLLVAVLMLLRTASAHRKMSASDELQLRHLLAGSRSEDSLAYFATRRDRSIVFSDDRRSAVSYRLVNGVALASGDPIGPEDCWPAAVDRWITTTRSFGWIPAVLSSTERGARLYKRYGLQSAVLGEEAIVATDRASAARMMEHPELRQANRRARRAGYTTQIRRQSECTDDELAQIAALADAWRDGDVERGFSMALSRIGDRADAHTVIATAHDADNAIAAILILVPWGDDGLSLDVMRRSPSAVNGTTEFLVSSLVSAAPALSVARISLNFAMLREVFVRGERAGATRRDRAQRAILLRLSKWWQLDSLRLSNEKYSPHWKPRLVSWPHGVSLGRIALTAAHAEGFLSLPFARLGGEKNPQDPTRPDGFPELVQAIKSAVRTPHAPRRSASSTARMLRAQELRRDGIELYPVAVARSVSVAEVRAAHEADDAADPGVIVHLAGRLRARRHHGGMAFFDLVEDHVTIQLIAAAHATVAYRDLLRLQTGDIVAVSGTVVRSASGELSIAVRTWQLASKSLHPLPRFGGLTDPEAVLRQRHIELATNPHAAWMVRARSHATQALRQGLLDDGYLEVETPILQNVHGGANARPFSTHINAYDADLSLRIAPELALKKLLVAGFPQVFEIGRNFRNEGADATHNPEFTAVEAYRAFADYTDMRHLAQRLITGMAVAVNGAPEAIGPDGSRIDLRGEWPVVSVCDAISAFVGIRVSPDLDIDVLRELARVYQVGLPAGESAGRIVEALYEELVEKSTTSPTFYTDFPAETSPLTRPHRRDPGLAERWDLVAFGVELGTAYSELVDPVEQRSRLTEQSLRAANRDPEAMELDESFLTALEFGMPPTGGLGLGVDRIIMLLTGATIRQTLAFPFARPEQPRW